VLVGLLVLRPEGLLGLGRKPSPDERI
jgi:hypothetical protein